jgi:hypothetical protein
MTHAEHLTEDHIKAATALYHELADAQGICFGIVSGSHAFGLGHATSDVDFYVMATDDGPLESRFYLREGFPVQVNVVTKEKLDRALAWGGDDSEFTTANRTMLDVQDDVRKLAIRLSRGHVVHADDAGRALLARFDPAVMRRRVIARQARDCGSHLEDVAGALAARDRNTAFTAARVAVTHACEAALAGCDDIYVGAKFLLRRLARVPALRDVLGQIREALDVPTGATPRINSLADDDFAVVERVLRERARLAAYLTAHTTLEGWESVLTAFPAMVTGDRGPLRDPFFTLLRFGDGIGLAGPDKSFRVSPDAGRLWLSLDGTRRTNEVGAGEDDPRVRGVVQFVKIGATSADTR